MLFRSVTLAEADGPAPTLFESGDLPDFTASGIDPQLLLKLPWQARHPVASAATQAVAYQLFAAYIDNVDGARIDAVCTADDGIVDYVERVSMWLAATGPKPAASMPIAAAALAAEDQSLDRLVDDLFDTPSERARVAEQQQARTDRAAVKASANAAKEVQAQARRTAVEAQRRRDHIAAARGGDPLLRPW